MWSQGSADVGKITGIAPVEITHKGSYRPYQRQYPLRREAIEGIAPVFKTLRERGVIIPCPDSPCNTPIFPVKKAPPSQSWRMVQDLKAVNLAVIPRAPIVPDPRTLLNEIPKNATHFSVID